MRHIERFDEDIEHCISSCSDCHDRCAETAIYAMQVHLPVNDTGLLLDCAQICDTARDFMLRGSPLHGETCAICAGICAHAAEMCAAQDSTVMRRCAEACARCRDSCATMAGSAAAGDEEQRPLAA